MNADLNLLAKGNVLKESL